MNNTLQVIFDTGGGITVQTDSYVHYYDNPAFAADDVRFILNDHSTVDWAGNNPDERIDNPHPSDKVYSADDLRAEQHSTEPVGDKYKGHAERAFIIYLTGREAE